MQEQHPWVPTCGSCWMSLHPMVCITCGARNSDWWSKPSSELEATQQETTHKHCTHLLAEILDKKESYYCLKTGSSLFKECQMPHSYQTIGRMTILWVHTLKVRGSNHHLTRFFNWIDIIQFNSFNWNSYNITQRKKKITKSHLFYNL